jgi:SAM-dependent methyltransferase
MPRIAQTIRSAVSRALSERLERRAARKLYRTRFGRNFLLTIDPRDEMLRFLREHRANPLQEYFSSGATAVSDFEDMLDKAGRSYDQVDSLLEFACGYGRMTRFLVHRMPRHKITVSDIDVRAVDFTTRTFGVRGFYSTAEAKRLTWNARHDVIFIASLFSHLSRPFWESWLPRLVELLEPAGLLVFSTHGSYALSLLGAETTPCLEETVPGFWFTRSNETYGRLPTDYYGTAYVSDDYVRAFVSSHRLGEMVAFHPAKLWEFQDLYVLRKQ